MTLNPVFKLIFLSLLVLFWSCSPTEELRQAEDFNKDWSFFLGETTFHTIQDSEVVAWRSLNLPHDWSIEGAFDEANPAGVGGGALPGGIGWYRKTFLISEQYKDKKITIQFDGVYQNSTVWVNDQLLGNRPNGYISFQYDLTPYLNYGGEGNVITVKVDNSQQPNSRWYSGSGIYRDVRLLITNKVHIEQWGTYVTASEISSESAKITIETTSNNELGTSKSADLETTIYTSQGVKVAQQTAPLDLSAHSLSKTTQNILLPDPERWTLERPTQYQAVSILLVNDKPVDQYETLFGIREFAFDRFEGFSLNGEKMKIKGVCLHHDLGCLGSAFNTRAMERQLEIMQAMGVNAIRTSHNPPAPQLLDLCDKMGLLVMDEMFDMWSISKSEFDYSLSWDEWHVRDLQDFIKRDRNHPSIIAWSIGNEIMEQYNHEDSTGGIIARELASIVRDLDTTRPITTANNDTSPDNPIIKFGGLDLIGVNYHHEEYERFLETYPNQIFIATETNSSLATRGHYDMPSDSLINWPVRWDLPFNEGNPDHTVSAYDHVRTPWGSTQEDTWRIIKKFDYLSGMFIWTGFDYIGEPTPYGWPSKSSYFGLVDLAGFPKDTYYMYQSEWTDDTVLHVFPHWNWQEGQDMDVWAYYNQADEVELFLNGESLGSKSKGEDEFHVMWRIKFAPGTLKAVSKRNGQIIKVKEIDTAGEPEQITLKADRGEITADGYDLSFVTVEVVDQNGNIVPYADDLIVFEVSGSGKIIGVDNGDPVSHESFKGNQRKAFHGKCLVVIQSTNEAGEIKLTATSERLKEATISITSR